MTGWHPLCRRSFPDAVTVRCFAFEPSDAQMQQDLRAMPGLLMFPPGKSAQTPAGFLPCLLRPLDWAALATALPPARRGVRTVVLETIDSATGQAILKLNTWSSSC